MRLLSRGDKIGAWTVVDALGQGGFAHVWRVESDDGLVGALKILHSTEGPRAAEQVARLRREARALADLDHPHIVALVEVVEDGGVLAIVTELVEGPNLAEWMNAALPDADTLSRLFEGILAGVEAAHQAGWVHRDLKPANVLVAPGEVAKVADFGLAHLADATRLTRTGSVMGTPSYMAPEQVRDPSGVSAQSDVFSLGAILYELWCGRPAFVGQDVVTTLHHSASGIYPNPRTLRPDLPGPIALAIDGALDPDPSSRIPDCATFRAVLSGELPWELVVRTAPATTIVEPPARRSWAPMLLGLGMVVLVALGLSAMTLQPPEEAHPIPVISPEPEVQAHFEAAWDDWLEIRVDDASDGLEDLAYTEHPWVFTLLAVVETTRGAFEDADAALARAQASMPPEPTGDVAAAAALVQAMTTDFDGDDNEIWATLAAQYPDTFPIQGVACIQLESGGAAERACLRAEKYGAPILHYARARASLSTNDLSGVDHHLGKLFSLRPAHPAGLVLEGYRHASQANWEEALAAAEAALAQDPELESGFLLRGVCRAYLGDDAGSQADFSRARASENWPMRVAAATTEAQALLGLGKVTHPLSVLESLSADAIAEGRWIDVVNIETWRGWLGWYLERPDQMQAASDHILRAAEVEGMTTDDRDKWRVHSAYLGGLIAVLDKDPDGVAKARREMSASDVTWFNNNEKAPALDGLWAHELALRGDNERELHLARTELGCEAMVEGGVYLIDAGYPDDGAERLIEAAEACSYTGQDRFLRFLGRQALAELAEEQGDAAQVTVHREAMKVLWPEPDSPHPKIHARQLAP